MAKIPSSVNRIQSFSSALAARNSRMIPATRHSLADTIGSRFGAISRLANPWVPALAQTRRFTLQLQRSINRIFARRRLQRPEVADSWSYSGTDSLAPSEPVAETNELYNESFGSETASISGQPPSFVAAERIMRKFEPLPRTQRFAPPKTDRFVEQEIARQATEPGTATPSEPVTPASTWQETLANHYVEPPSYALPYLPLVLRSWRPPDRRSTGTISTWPEYTAPEPTVQAGAEQAASPLQRTLAGLPAPIIERQELGGSFGSNSPRSTSERAIFGDWPTLVPNAARTALGTMERVAGRVAPAMLKAAVQRALALPANPSFIYRQLRTGQATPATEPDAAENNAALAVTPAPQNTLPTAVASLTPPAPAGAGGLEHGTERQATAAEDRVITGWGWSPLLSALVGGNIAGGLPGGSPLQRETDELPATAGPLTHATLQRSMLQFGTVERVLTQVQRRRRAEQSELSGLSATNEVPAQPAGVVPSITQANFALSALQPPIGMTFAASPLDAQRSITDQVILGEHPSLLPAALATSLMTMDQVAERVAPPGLHSYVQRMLDLPTQSMVLPRAQHTSMPGAGEQEQSEPAISAAIAAQAPTIVAPAAGMPSATRQSEDRALTSWGWSPMLSVLVGALPDEQQAQGANIAMPIQRMFGTGSPNISNGDQDLSWIERTWSTTPLRVFASIQRRINAGANQQASPTPANPVQLWSAEPGIGLRGAEPISDMPVFRNIRQRMLRREWGGGLDFPAMTLATMLLRRHEDANYIEEGAPADFAEPAAGKPSSAEITGNIQPLRSVEPMRHIDQTDEMPANLFDRPEQIVAYARAGRLPGAGPSPSWSPGPALQRSGWSGSDGFDFETTPTGRMQEREAQDIEADLHTMVRSNTSSVGVTYGRAAANSVQRAMQPHQVTSNAFNATGMGSTNANDSVQRASSFSIPDLTEKWKLPSFNKQMGDPSQNVKSSSKNLKMPSFFGKSSFDVAKGTAESSQFSQQQGGGALDDTVIDKVYKEILYRLKDERSRLP